jgi:hypothetical protein
VRSISLSLALPRRLKSLSLGGPAGCIKHSIVCRVSIFMSSSARRLALHPDKLIELIVHSLLGFLLPLAASCSSSCSSSCSCQLLSVSRPASSLARPCQSLPGLTLLVPAISWPCSISIFQGPCNQLHQAAPGPTRPYQAAPFQLLRSSHSNYSQG